MLGRFACRADLCNPQIVRNSLYRRWSLVLGMLAMLGAVLSVPLSAAHALSIAGSHHEQQVAAAKHDMPCHSHKPVRDKHCPNCPQKGCPDIASCLAKCSQQLTPLLTGARLPNIIVGDRILPAADGESAGALTPQLLRPPSA